MRSQKSYFEDQHQSVENVRIEESRFDADHYNNEFLINNENEGDELREGSAYLVQESNGPGCRCRKGSLNMRNKLNNKGVKNKLLNNYHLKLYNKHSIKNQDTFEVTSDGS